jgi:hypothetical protein
MGFLIWTRPNLTDRQEAALSQILLHSWPDASLAESLAIGAENNAKVLAKTHQESQTKSFGAGTLKGI